MAEAPYLAAIRESYDAVADDYVKRIKPPADMEPDDRAMLAAFAELVRRTDRGPVADLGCGPGRVAAYLAQLGVSIFGVDLSPTMIELARQAYPSLRFIEGSMTALDIGDQALGGVLAWYSTFHTPPEQLPVVFAEFHRTLAPGGHVLLATHVGDEHLRPERAYGGHPVSYEAYLMPTDRIVALLRDAGLIVTARLVHEPEPGATRSQACIRAHKSEQS